MTEQERRIAATNAFMERVARLTVASKSKSVRPENREWSRKFLESRKG